MGRRSAFGRISGWGTLVWLFCFGPCMLLMSNMKKPSVIFGMAKFSDSPLGEMCRLMLMWDELNYVTGSIQLSSEEDQIMWSYSSSEKYSVQSLYAVINHRGVVPVFVQAVSKLFIAPRVQFFLWLLSNNKLLTRDNLVKRRTVNDPSCLFCEEGESINHLFFQCCVAVNVWEFVSAYFSRTIDTDFESVASLWLSNRKFLICNTVSSAVLMEFFVFSGSTMAGDEEGVCTSGQDAKRLAADVQADGLGTGGTICSDSGS